jgi:hypothetical protein
MLEAIGPEGVLIDGNEGSYYLDESRKYVENSDQGDYPYCKVVAPKALCAPELLAKWGAQGQVAMAPYFDMCYNLYEPFPWRTPEYEGRWMKHNVYHSLMSSDRYVWLYFERLNFWTGAGAPKGTDPIGDIREGIALYRAGRPLGYDMYKPEAGFQYQNDKPATFVSSPVVTMRVERAAAGASRYTLEASVAQDQRIAGVEFYVNSRKVSRVERPPYRVTIDLPKSASTVFARVFTVDGTHTTSAPVHVEY